MKWQERRVKRALADGYVLACHSVSPPSKGEILSSPLDRMLLTDAGHVSATEFLEESCAAVATIQPVRPSWGWSLRAILPRLWLWLAEWIDPVHDLGADEDVSEKMPMIDGILLHASHPILRVSKLLLPRVHVARQTRLAG